MRGMAVLLALLASGCVRTATSTCDDGTVCREGTTCHAVGAGDIACVTPEQIEACTDAPDGVACLADTGTCYGGACIPDACGNGRTDASESCDDGDLAPGDGCSASCEREVCGNGVVDGVREDASGQLVVNEQCDLGDSLGHDGCSSGCLAELPRWVDMVPAPTARTAMGLVAAADTHRAILFGGRNGTVFFNDTWELSGEGWRRLPTALAPTPRAQLAMASDGTRVLLFGGSNGASALADTWLLDGDAWTTFGFTAAESPPGRVASALAYVPSLGYVLFGGSSREGVAFDDTWVFSDGAWHDISAIAGRPPARATHGLVYDPVRDRLLLVGGVDANGYVADTWELAGMTWTRVGDAPQVADPNVAFDRIRGRVVLHGGFGPAPMALAAQDATRSETYEWTGSAWQRIAMTPALEREDAGVFGDPDTGRLVVFGGTRTPVCPMVNCQEVHGDLYAATASGWTEVAYRAFPTRDGIAATLDVDRGRVVAFGGREGFPQNETFELSAHSWKKLAPALSPGARTRAALAYARFPTGRATYLFGGNNGTSALADTWAWDGTTWAQVGGPQPTARSGHGMAFDAARQRIVLFGGDPVSDTWEFDGTTWTQRVTAQPPARTGHAMAYDPIRRRVLVFGGTATMGSREPLGDFWAWDGTTWTQLALPLAPPPRTGAGMAWDAARERIVLFGGSNNDTWEWDGTAWSFAQVIAPPRAHQDIALVASPTGAGVISLGGTAALIGEIVQTTNDVLYFAYDAASANAGCRSSVDDDRDGASGCADADCWAVCTPWCPPGAPCDPAAPRCGDGVCEPTREHCGICAADCPCP